MPSALARERRAHCRPHRFLHHLAELAGKREMALPASESSRVWRTSPPLQSRSPVATQPHSPLPLGRKRIGRDKRARRVGPPSSCDSLYSPIDDYILARHLTADRRYLALEVAHARFA